LPRFRSLFIVVLVCSFLASSLPGFTAKNSAKNLAPTYRHWLEVEVPYIISSVERTQFLSLTSDSERESFIETFWKARNPEPNSDSNAYKDEHYRRLAYANEHFGTAKYEDGWRSDMGRMYIILGAPKQRAPYHALANVREMEIWFYQSDSPALPPFFYLLFYKRSTIDPYTLYSPVHDGPVRLVSTGESRNDPVMALSILRKFAGDEVAKTAITLLPNKSVSFDSFDPDMQSDMLMATISGLPDNPLNKDRMQAYHLDEHVTTSILTGEVAPELSYSVFRDDKGGETVSYLLKSYSPDPRIIGTGTDKSLHYDITLRTSVLTAAGKSVYDQEEQLTGKLTDAQAEVAKKKRFAAEGRLPLVPGKYNVVATLTNNLTQTATRQHAMITVPTPKSSMVGISPLVAYTLPAATPDPAGTLPFTASKFRFTPRGAQTVSIRQGEKLPLVFQLWLDPKVANSTETEKIHIRYVFGAVTGTHESPSEEGEEVDATNRDAAGNFLTGHTVDTSSLTPGTYQLVVGANRVGKQQTAYESMTLHVESASSKVDAWTAYGAVAPNAQELDDLKRGLSAEAQGTDEEAQRYYTKALSEGQDDSRPLDSLTALLARRGQTDDLAALSQLPILSRTAIAPKTLLAIVQALTKNKNSKPVIKMLEIQMKLQPPNADLYRTLADAYETTGDSSKARDARELAGKVK
jgi:GWxTD domain-containing protein